MKKISRQIFIEVLWLALSFVLAFVLTSFIAGWSFSEASIDLHLHDTYFVISRWLVLLSFFFLLAFVVYFIKEFRNSFSRILPGWVFISLGVTLVIFLSFQVKNFSVVLNGGWTIYPPLSALGSDQAPEIEKDPASVFLTNFLLVVQLIALLMLLFGVYRWGRQKRSNKF